MKYKLQLLQLWLCVVAPARERGLKLIAALCIRLLLGRSREGAWIEILLAALPITSVFRRSREGAWIEIAVPNSNGKFELSSLPRGSVD